MGHGADHRSGPSTELTLRSEPIGRWAKGAFVWMDRTQEGQCVPENSGPVAHACGPSGNAPVNGDPLALEAFSHDWRFVPGVYSALWTVWESQGWELAYHAARIDHSASRPD